MLVPFAYVTMFINLLFGSMVLLGWVASEHIQMSPFKLMVMLFPNTLGIVLSLLVLFS